MHRDLLDQIPASCERKYPMGYPTDSSVYRVQPEVVFGIVEDPSQFAGAATRWYFTR